MKKLNLTERIVVPISAKQQRLVDRAVEKTGLRVPDLCRFGVFEYLQNPKEARYVFAPIWIDEQLDEDQTGKFGAPKYGATAVRLTVQLTAPMMNQLNAIALDAAEDVIALARIAVLDFCRRNQA